MVNFSKLGLPSGGGYWKWLGVATVTAALAIGVHHYWLEISRETPKEIQRRKQEAGNLIFHEVLFFPDKGIGCENYASPKGCSALECEFSHLETSYIKLLNYLKQTKKTLNIAIFIMTCPKLAQAIVNLKRKGVVVRVITDNEMMITVGSQIGLLRKSGIAVRHKAKGFIMHHKFAIIDGHTVLNGSFNWTTPAITGNNENITITNQPNVVDSYKNEFEKLWEEFTPRSALLTLLNNNQQCG